MLHVPVGLRFENFEGQVFQFPLEPADAQAVGQGGVDLAGFAGDALLFLRLEGREGAHVVQPIGQLHQHHPDVTGHGQEHAAQIFRLGFCFVGEVDAAKFGNPLHQGPHLSAEVALDLVGGDFGVLHHVVQEASGNHAGTGADVAQQVGDGDRMNDVGLAAGSVLALVQLVGEIKGRGQQRLGVGGAAVAAGLAVAPVLDAALQPFRQGHAVVAGARLAGLIGRPVGLVAEGSGGTPGIPGQWRGFSQRVGCGQLGGSVIGGRFEHSTLRVVPIVCTRRHRPANVRVQPLKLERSAMRCCLERCGAAG